MYREDYPERIVHELRAWSLYRDYFLKIQLFYIAWRTDQGLYQLLTMVNTGGTRTCVHPHVSRPLYHCATDADRDYGHV